MLSLTNITELVKNKLTRMLNGLEGTDHFGIDVSICREGNNIIIIYQPSCERMPGTCFIYRKAVNIWILEYRLDVQQLVPDVYLKDFKIDAWMHSDAKAFTVKLCSLVKDPKGYTFEFRLNEEEDEYVLQETGMNDRFRYQGKDYFIR